MKTGLLSILGTFCLSAMLVSCGSKDKEQNEDDGATASVGGTLNAVQEMAKQAEEAQKNGPVETVDFRKLKELLPAEADGLARKSATGEKNGMAGFTISTATARYENADNSENIELALVDAGGSGALMGLAAWTMVDVDKETEDGYERTTKMGDNKCYEKYTNSSKSGEIAMVVKSRYIVTAKGNGVSMEKLKSALEAIDTDELVALK
ncbi:transposase [Fibrella sp. WM1]|uniref:transposase n=1 Tax=Fibrella musci TaxID=3242485 RepID=UPI0035204532